MRFRASKQQSSIPEVNLVPMMDVIMTILTFFIIISMTLSSSEFAEISLPGVGKQSSNSQKRPADPLVVGLNIQGQTLLKGGPVSPEGLAQQVTAYLSQSVDGVVVLRADKEVPYQDVVKLLSTLRDLGGDRVSLALE